MHPVSMKTAASTKTRNRSLFIASLAFGVFGYAQLSGLATPFGVTDGVSHTLFHLTMLFASWTISIWLWSLRKD